MIQKDVYFVFQSIPGQMFIFFRALKSFIIKIDPFLGHPCIAVSPKTTLFWFHCQLFWTPYGSQILEWCAIMLVEFVFYGQYSEEPCLVIAKNLGKNKIFIVLQWFLGNFEQLLKKLFFHPKNAKTLGKISCYSSMVGSTWCIVWPKLCVVRPTHCVTANTMGCVAWWFGKTWVN